MSTTIFLAAGDLGQSFRKLVDETFIRVDGCLVERVSSGYKVFGREVKTMEAVKETISQAKNNLNNSIKK